MFSLIITIISIALVAALALATIYYGGDAFTQGGDAAKAAQIINEGQQLQGALTLRSVQEPTATALTVSEAPAVLAPDYLAQVPADWTVNAAGDAFVSPTVSAAVCNAVNVKAGFAKDATVVAGDLTDKVYGCVTGATTPTVSYKF